MSDFPPPFESLEAAETHDQLLAARDRAREIYEDNKDRLDKAYQQVLVTIDNSMAKLMTTGELPDRIDNELPPEEPTAA